MSTITNYIFNQPTHHNNCSKTFLCVPLGCQASTVGYVVRNSVCPKKRLLIVSKETNERAWAKHNIYVELWSWKWSHFISSWITGKNKLYRRQVSAVFPLFCFSSHLLRMRTPSFRYATGNTHCFVLRYELFVTVRLQSNYSELFGCNRAIFVLCWCCEWSNNWQDCQTVTNTIVNAPELPERQQNKILFMQVEKNASWQKWTSACYLQYTLWACFICMFMKDKVFLETRMNNLNTIKLDFATTLCSYFLQWILCSLYL